MPIQLRTLLFLPKRTYQVRTLYSALLTIFTALILTLSLVPSASAQDPHKTETESAGQSAPEFKPSQGESQNLEADKNGDRKKVFRKRVPKSAFDRVTFEVLGGLGGLVAAAKLGAIGAGIAAIGEDCSGEEENYCGLGPALAWIGTSAVAAVFTLPLGVYLVGNAAGGKGNYWATLLGHILGAAAGWAIAIPVLNNGSNGAIVALPVITHFAGAVLGYELSFSSADQSRGSDGAAAISESSLLIAPAIRLTSDGKGLAVGITGSYSLSASFLGF